MKRTLPLIFLALSLFSVAPAQDMGVPITPILNCPDASIGVLRAGFNADIGNPTYIYSVNSITGAFTLYPGGPLKYPDNPAMPLHVNGFGINSTDGLLYGLAQEGTFTTARFVRFGVNYGSHLISNIASPTSPTGPLGFVNSAAGDVDRSNNYFFTAFTLNPTPIPHLDKFFLGKISNISALSNAAIPEYFEIDVSQVNCSGYLASLAFDPDNSGLKDLAFSPFTNTFFGYATYKPTGAPSYTGQLIELKPIPGSSPLKYMMFCTPVFNSHNAETAGVLIDKVGTFLILFTDGTVGKIGNTSPLNYTGNYIPVNNSTGLPSVLRGDLGSCGGSEGALPVTLLSFNAADRDCKTIFSWEAENEINFKHYELQQSFDNVNFVNAGIIARKSAAKNSYSFTLASPAKEAAYRLKMVDLDGKFYYSSVERVNSNCKKVNSGFVINPNPVENSLNINWYGITARTQVTVKVFNAQGSLVKNSTIAVNEGNSINNIGVDNLAPGAYFIKVVDAKNKANFEGRFVKK